MDGYLLIDKPTGMSSFAALAKVRRIIREATGNKVKIGHTGTLDPAASGLLILALGSYTKRASDFSKLDKSYDAQLTLGFRSTTADREGEITAVSKQIPTEQKVAKALNTFSGLISQTPPAHSAVKIGGQRAYKLARAGKTVQIEPRKVTIYSIENIKYEYPKLSFTTTVSSGTYIRSLAQDIGEKLGVGAYLSDLRRLSVGEFNIRGAASLENLDFNTISTYLKQGLSKR